MELQKHYKGAPITEALIDLRVELPSEVAVSTLKEIHHSVRSDYPMCEDMVMAQGQFQTGPSVAAIATQTHIGYRFSSGDGKQILQVRLDGFTLNRLAPYERWESFRDEARRLWEFYYAVANPKNINRVAIRYINRLDLPLPLSDFKDYLRTVPEVAPDLPQGLADYFMQLQIPQEDLEGMLVLIEALIPPPVEKAGQVVSILLDIDLFCSVILPGNGESQWKLLEKLRVRKNEVFEACITDKTRELFTDGYI